MVAGIISLVLLAVLILIAVKMISVKRPPTEESYIPDISDPLIHASGIYSIVRKCPREDLKKIRPPESEIRKYLAGINEDSNKRVLSSSDKSKLVERWNQFLEENIKVVEKGDTEEIEFYFLDFSGTAKCPVCSSYFKQGQFVTRQEIFKHPAIIPPFHLGCTTRLVPFKGKEKLTDTTILGMTPLFRNNTLPPLPDWKKIINH